MIKESHVTYNVGMALKRVGFDEWCTLLYSTAITHNGEHISFDEELDLKGAGREKEIEYIPGGICGRFTNKNSLDYISQNDDVCSCPTVQMAIAWLEQKHHIYVMPAPYKPGEWKTAIIYTDNPHPDDGKLCLCELDGICNSWEAAADAGLKYGLDVVSRILKAKGGEK